MANGDGRIPEFATIPPFANHKCERADRAACQGVEGVGLIKAKNKIKNKNSVAYLAASPNSECQNTVLLDENILPATGCQRLGTAAGAGVHFDVLAIVARSVRDVYFDPARACFRLLCLCRGCASGESQRVAVVDIACARP